MNNTLKGILIFLGGAVTGGLVTGLIVHGVTRKKCDDEVHSVIETFSEREKAYMNKEHTEIEKPVEKHVEEPAEETKTEEQVNAEEKEYNKLVNAYHEAKDQPFLIDEYDYGMAKGYSQDLLYYYADGALKYEHEDEPLTQDYIQRFVGIDNIAGFGDIPEDRIYVRCPELSKDYEIVFKDEKYYKEDDGG